MVAPAAVTALLVLVAFLLQTSVAEPFAWDGVVPHLVLLVVVGCGLARGADFALIAGFAAGLLVDLAPPADHVVGRWAFSLLLVGWIAGRWGESLPRVPATRPSWWRRVLPWWGAAAACSFAGTSLFALTGLLVGDVDLDVTEVLSHVVIALIWDCAAAVVVIPAVLSAFRPGRSYVLPGRGGRGGRSGRGGRGAQGGQE